MKSLKEDKIITKEDEGISFNNNGGGEISTTPSETPSDGISNDKNGSVSTSDILGPCPVKDHNCTGFFANKSFYVPYPIFSVPSYRIKKRKKKYVNMIDLTESGDFSKFKEISEPIILKVLDDANNELKEIDSELNVTYDVGYKFDDYKADWVAAINKENQDNIKTFKIAINLPILFNYLDERSLSEDMEEIRCQITASIYHELAHGIIQFCKDMDIYDFEFTDEEEEMACEEYAKYHLKEYTNVNQSKIQNFIDEIFKNAD